ncbi:TraR/DksA family transcriptional regulator [Bacillus pumilus]|uniref:TraR/DksA family transcriptional regulator n=1 Tax=Bacillus pumilus TaxID=1408 RepID=UPI00203A4469|nr:TraR/DksA family transcriptional regulator [Bacillus pumilus]MCM3149495.1 TraR/DksA family transcriptional regulator [Bacillus pumilus]
MNGDLETIYTELLQMKEELQAKLFEYASFRSPAEHVSMNEVQTATLLYHIKEELQDVSLAIAKIEQGTFGICEATGDVIPLEQMSILPTARTANDFLYHKQYEKKAFTPYPHESDDSHFKAFHM